MAGDEMTRFDLFLHWLDLSAAFHAVCAAGMELAAFGRICRGGDGALEHDPVHLDCGIRDRNG